MDRFLMDELVAWKDSPRRKPLILNGARQVGKTWLLKEFGRRCFDNVAYVNLDDNPGMREQFEAGYDIPRIISAIRFETGQAVSEGGTLIVLDEIQACPKALTSLKYFCENTPGYAVAAWRSIPTHLGRENKKFMFSHIAEGARARNYRSGITWLSQAGIATIVRRISKPGIPLAPYADDAAFKLFLVDVGLLGAMAQLDKETVVGGNEIFEEFKGSLTEQYVCQQLVSDCGLVPYYWSTENSSGEIDFLVQRRNSVFAIEVKAEENLRSKSLRAFKESHPDIEAVRFILSKCRERD